MVSGDTVGPPTDVIPNTAASSSQRGGQVGVLLPWTVGAWQPGRPVAAGPQGLQGPARCTVSHPHVVPVGILRDEYCLPL